MEAETPQSEIHDLEGPLLPPRHLPSLLPLPSPNDAGQIVNEVPPLDLELFIEPPQAPSAEVEEAPAGRALADSVRPTVVSRSIPETVPKLASDAISDRLSENPFSDLTETSLPTGSRVQELARQKIQRGYSFARRGAYFAAEREFVESLRMITRHKDFLSGRPNRTESLAAGFRALDEAADYFPGGTQLEANVDVLAIRASHLTKLTQTVETDTQPQHVMDQYLRYGQLQLGAAVAGEPAGSMALHALGKLQSQLRLVEPERNPIASQKAIALQKSAILAREDNYLAAHELGLLLAESGRLERAEELLAAVSVRQPNAVVLHNLGTIQSRLGRHEFAEASLRQANVLAQAGLGPSAAVETVSPQEFQRMSPQPTQQDRASVGSGDSMSPTGGRGLRVAGNEVFSPAAETPNRKPSRSVLRSSFASPAAQWR